MLCFHLFFQINPEHKLYARFDTRHFKIFSALLNIWSIREDRTLSKWRTTSRPMERVQAASWVLFHAGMWVTGRWLSSGNQSPHILEDKRQSLLSVQHLKYRVLISYTFNILAIFVSASHFLSPWNADDKDILLISTVSTKSSAKLLI